MTSAQKIAAYLRMTQLGGTYPAGDGQSEYESHADTINFVFPNNGGKLQSDGTWLQESWKFDNAWKQGLKIQKHSYGATYLPVVNQNSILELTTVLDSTELQQQAG